MDGLVAPLRTPPRRIRQYKRERSPVRGKRQGAVSGIARKTVAAMAARWNTRPEDLLAAIGPGIGPCCFEVGPEVAVQFGEPAQRTRIDLPDAVRRHLLTAGLDPTRIETAGLCTACLAGEFHSYRRDREKAGRMISFIGV